MKANTKLISMPIFYGVMGTVVMICQFGLLVQPSQSATLYWDTDTSTALNNADGTGLGGAGTWDVASANWWDGTALGMWPNTSEDIAIFSAPATLLPALSTVTLSSGITANQLSFLRSGYLLTGGDLTLAGTTPTLSARLAEMVTIESQILGTEGLAVTGGGTVRLTNAANSYTGTTTVSSGILSINSNGALGTDLSTIVVTGSATRGFAGGALMLAGGYNSGVTLARDVSLQGLGPVPAFGAALLSVGNNTITGLLSNGPGTLITGISSAGGRLTLTDVAIAGTTGTTFLTVGVGSSLAGVPGSGSYAITGVLSGSGSIQKSGGGTLIIDPTSAVDYSGTFRIYSGSIRFESVAAFGSNVGVGTLSTLDLAGDSAILELRMDNPVIGKNVYNRAGGSPIIFVDHAIGSSTINGTAAFGTLTYDDGETITFNGRNGYGVSFKTAPVITGDGNTAFTNNLNGTLTFTGDFWSNPNNSGNRTMTIGGTGNTVINGNIIATATTFGQSIVKSGTGTLTVTGAASTYTGNTSITGGVLSVLNLGGINKNSTTGSIILGATTTTGTFQYTGAADTLAKPFSLGGTTAGGAILSDGTGPLTITGNVGASGAGIKTLFLGGGNTGDNTFSGLLINNNSTNTTGLMKIGDGTWVLKEPTAAASGTATSVTIAAPGSTATNVVTLSSGTTAGLLVGQTTSILSTLPQITGILDDKHFTISSTITTATAPAGSYNVNAIPAASTSTTGGTWSGPLTIANGVLKLQATNAASNIVPDSNAVAFNVDTYTVNQAAGGTLEFVGVAGLATTESLGTLLLSAGAGTVRVTAGSGGTATLALAAIGTSQMTTAASTGSTTITLASTVGLVPGMRLNGGSAAATISSITNGTQIVVSAAQTIASSVTLTFDRPNGGATVNFDPDANSTVIIGSVPAVGVLNAYSYFNGADFAYASGTSNVVLRAPVYNVDAGFVTSAGGTNVMSATNHYELTGNVTGQAAATINSLKMTGGVDLALTGLLTIRTGAAGTSGGILVTGGSATISGTGVTTGGAADLIIRVDGALDVLNLNAPVTATTTGGLTKTGAGTLVIGGQNAYTTGGVTSLLEGTIKLTTGGRLSANSVNLVMRQDTTLDLNGVNTAQTSTTSSIGAFNGNGTVTNTSTNPVVFAVGGGTTGGSGTFNGVINEVSGVISVVKMGTTNSQVWNGLSNYTGSTTIGVPGTGTTGSLSVFTLANIGFDSSIGRGDKTSLATNQGSLVFGGTTGGLIYIGTTSASTDRLFTMAGTVATAGATITNNAVNNQALIFSNYGPIAFASANPQLLQLSGTSTSDNWFNPQITDSGTGANITSVNKLAAGLWILGNTNNIYTGTTTITEGMLMAQDGASLPNSSGLILGGTTTVGIFQSSGDFTRNLAPSASAGTNTISWNSALTSGGGGFAASSDKLVVSIGGLASPTALTWNSGGFMGTAASTTGPLVLNSVTALGEVEFRNAIDLAGAVRTILVNDNVSTFTDFATISGVISGNGGISKTGTGLLQLLGDNTYTGTTAVTAGQLVVTSLGNTTNPGASSLGDSTSANTQSSALTLGNASTTAGILQYVGAGEISDRMIRLNTTTGNTQILADGTGPLILTNVLNDMQLGAKSLYLRGGNVQGNMITSDLANNGGNLTITADMGATWILSGNNSYSGNTNITAGALGAGSDTAFGTSTIVLRNGALFAYGAARTLANAVSINSTTSGGTSVFIGDYALTMTGVWNYSNTTTGHTITNGMTPGTTLTLGGDMVLNALTTSVSLAFNGTGNTSLNGNIVTSTAFNVNISYTGDGTLTLGGINTTAGITTLNNNNGTIRLVGAGKLATGPLTVNAGTLSIESVNQSVALLTMGNVAGTNATINVASGLTLSVTGITFAGTTTLPSTITGAGTLDLGAAGITVTVADNITQSADMVWTIANLTGSGIFTKAGTGTLDFSGIANNSFTGSYQVTAGAIMGLDALTNNLALNGGVYQTSGTFTRALGTGSNQVQFLAAGGGFAAVGGDLTVTFAGAPSPLVWGGTPSFVSDGAPLIFGSTAADSVTDFTHDIDLNNAVRTISAVDNTTAVTDWALLSGVLSNGGLTKTGNGILRLGGANTFAGGLTVTAGTVQFTTIGTEGGGPNNLGQGTITLNGGILSFVGDGAGASQTTDRTIFGTATSSNLAANGTNGATITYAGNIDLTGFPASASLLLTGTGTGFITGGISMTGGSADIQPQSGTWNFSGTPSTLTDDFIITGASVVVNLDSTGVLTWGASPSTSPNFYLRGGATTNLGADNAITFVSTSSLIMGDASGTAAVNTLNMNGFDLTVPILALGAVADVYAGVITGPGTLTVTGTGTLSRGSISADLAGAASLVKTGSGTVTLSGDNSGLNGTASTTISAGTLILDYATQNGDKLSAGAALTMTGGTVRLEGNASADTTQNLNGLVLSAGSSTIELEQGGTQSLTLNAGAITRNANGVIHLSLSDNAHVLTSATNGFGDVLAGWATINNRFAGVSGGELVAVAAVAKDDLTTWAAGDNLTDLNGYFNTVGTLSVNSLVFESANASTVTIGAGNKLTIASGGILVVEGAGAGGITGGELLVAVKNGNLVITQNNTAEDFTISSSITDTSITKAGAGTLVLAGNNDTSNQALYIGGGTVRALGGHAIGDLTVVTLSNSYGVDTTLDLSDQTETIGGLAGGVVNDTLHVSYGLVQLGATGMLIDDMRAAASLSANLAGGDDSTFVKSGWGLLTTNSGASSFTGALIINQGGIRLDGNTNSLDVFSKANSITLNGAGTISGFNSYLISDQDQSGSIDLIGNTTSITLANTAANTFNGVALAAAAQGLIVANNQNASRTETVGQVFLQNGQNSIFAYTYLADSNTAAIGALTMAGLTRQGHATLLVAGTRLGGAAALPTGRITITGVTSATMNLTIGGVGGGSTAIDTPNLSIVPYMIGQTDVINTTSETSFYTATGNSFVTYGVNGLRPLDLNTEYEQLVAGGGVTGANNVRYSSESDLTLDGANKTMNSLLVDNSSTTAAMTLNGAGASLNVASGAFLFTSSGVSPQGITLTNFSTITTGTGEYIVFVPSVAANTVVTVDSPLTTSAAALVKSGNGILKLTSSASTYGGGTWINQGLIEISTLDALGTGDVNFDSGGIRWAAGAAFDPSDTARALTFLSGGAVFDTNGNDVSVANAIGNGGSGGLIKLGEGLLTLTSTSVVDFGGSIIVAGGTTATSALVQGVAGALPSGTNIELGLSGIAGGYLDIGGFSTTLGGLQVNNTSIIAGSADLTFTGSAEVHGSASRTLTINNTGLTTFDGDFLVLVDRGGTARTLTINGTGNVTINSRIADGAFSGNLSYAGSGMLTLSNSGNNYTGTTTINNAGGTVILAGDNVLGSGVLALTAGTLSSNGTDRVITNNVTHGGTFIIGGDDRLTFTGTWTNSAGNRTLTVNTAGGVELAGQVNLSESTTSARSLTINGTGDVLISGAISNGIGTGASALNYTGSGTLTLTGSNTYTGLTTMNNTVGSLVFAGASQISGTALTVSAGTVQLNPAFDQTVGNLIMGGGGAGTSSNLLIGAGKTLTLAGTVTYSNSGNPLVATIDGGVGAILDFGGVARTFIIGDSSNAEPDMIIGANVTLQNDGGGGLIKQGTGTLHIAGTNHLTGPILIQAGAVTGDLGTGNLSLNNGVYEGNGTFTRSLGAGGGQIQWVAGASGGFAASGGALTVTLDSAPDPLVWDSTPFFVSGAGGLLFGSTTADSVVTFTHNLDLNNTASPVTRTVTVNDNTDVTTDKAVLSGVLSNSGAAATLNKAGAGILELAGANTFSALTLSSGTLQFSTVSNNGGGPSNLGQGTDGITLSGGILSFIGDGVANSQSTDRAITVTASTTLNASGTNGATITYAGAITAAAQQVQLTGSANSAGFITGGIVQNSTGPDLLVSSGNWTISGTPVVVGDDFKINGVGTVLNLNTTGVLSYVTGTSNFIYMGNGSTVNLNADDVSSVALGLEGILVGFETTGVMATLNTNTFNITTSRLDVGQPGVALEGSIIGSGTITVTGTTSGSGLSLYRGSVSANLAGVGAFLKGGMGDVTLSGDNSGLTGVMLLSAGNLILDYTASNTNKLNAATALDMRGGTLTINGSASAPTSQTVASFTLGNSGSNKIVVNGGAGQDAVLNLGAITRASVSQDGTVRFVLPSGTQSATNGITTGTVNGTHGLLGLSGFATVTDSTGTWFATNATNIVGGNIVALVSTIKNDVTTWLNGDHITDDAAGFTGTLSSVNINSLRFNAAGGSEVNIPSTGLLNIASGGILVTDKVTSGTPGIQGGTLASGVSEIIVTQDSTQTFEISSDIRINHAITKTGAGTLLLSGSNVYTGATEIQDGTLQVSGGNAIGDTSLVTLADDHYTTLQLLADEVIGRLTGGSAVAGLADLATVDIGTYTLTTNQSAATTYAGLITGTGVLVKNGPLFDMTLTNISSGFTGVLRINGGGIILSGIGQINASSIEINKGGYLRLVDSSTTRSGNRIPDATSITLNSADGGIAGNLLPRGFYINTDQPTTLDETVGVVTLGSGASYATLEATASTNDADSDIIMANLLRTNGATLDIRGTNLGTTNAQANQFRIGTTANQTAFIATLVGGGGAAASQNISIVPWAIGETLTGALAATNMGNSLVTYVSGAGLRPLNFATEYDTFTSSAVTENVRESLSADLTGLAGKTINALVIDNSATLNDINFTGTGAGQALTNTSGAFLFTLNTAATASTAYSITLGGFDSGITVGGTNEYIFFVVNPSSVATTATLTANIASPLTSTADITKSGRGTLVLSNINTAGGGSMKTTINEGTLEISDLDNIGGTAGGLIFAGGTLRLGTGFTDDLSTRTITFLNGGGTIDTNGIDLVLANSVGSGVGGLTKTGLGNLTLNAPTTYTGNIMISGGTLTIGADNATGLGGDLTIGGGATLDIGTFSITAGLVTSTGASPTILGSGTITASTGFSFGNTGDIGVDAILAGTGGLLKTQANILTLSGLSTFTGSVEIQAGTVSFNSITNVGGGASAMGNAATAQDGVIHMGLGSTATALMYTGSGSSSDRTIGLQGTTGAVTVDASGTGALTLGGVHFETAGNKTLTLTGTADPALANTLGNINDNGLGVLTLIKSGANTWVFNSANSYTGATSINDGILRFTADQTLTGALNFGSANSITTAGTLDLSSASATFAGAMLVQTNSVTETNELILGAGETLTIGGTVTLGSAAATSTTLFTASGAGALTVMNTTGTGVTFLVGGTGTTNVTTADFSALASMNVSLNTTGGILQVGSTSSTNSTGYGTLVLAQDTIITASALTVGGGGTYNGNAGQVNELKLGTSSNIINVGSVNIGSGSRDLGSITFLDSNGTVTIRAANGVGAAAFNMGSGSSTTAALLPEGNGNIFDVSGHTADLLFGAMNIGTQAGRTGPLDNFFAFDAGTLTAGNLTLGSKTAAGNSTNVMNLGGGVVVIGSGTGTGATLGSNSNSTTSTGAVSSIINVTGGTVTIGAGIGQSLILGNSNANAAGSTTTALNVSNGNVTLATTGPTAVTMANAAAGTATATISVTGGSLTVQGAILAGTGAGTRNSTITLNGGTLDMSGKVIGASTNAITFIAQSGTLQNLAELNGGGAFLKATGGTLYMGGVNSYTGTTTVSAGTLQFLQETAFYNNTPANWTEAKIVISSGATAAFNVGGTGEFTASDVDVIKSLGTAGGGFQSGAALGLDTTNASGGSFTYGGVIADPNGGANSLGLEKMGANTLVLTQTSTYTGPTLVSAGTLQIGDGTSGALAGAGIVTVNAGATLSGSGGINGSTIINSAAILAPGVGNTDSSNQTLTFTAAGVALDIKDGGQIQLSLTSSTQTDAAFNASGDDALTYLNNNGGVTGTAYTTIWAQSGNYDSIKLINGDFNLGSTAGGTVKLVDNNSALTLGSIFKLLDWSSVGVLDSVAGSGSFTIADLDLLGLSLGTGFTWDMSAFTTYGVIVVVPEPSRMLLLMLGLCGFMLRRRR